MQEDFTNMIGIPIGEVRDMSDQPIGIAYQVSGEAGRVLVRSPVSFYAGKKFLFELEAYGLQVSPFDPTPGPKKR